MKPGTPGFYGERLVEAREARQLTGVALAATVGVARNSISQYESNQQTPRPEVMSRITEVTNLPIGFFLRQPAPDASRIFHYRSLAAATKTARASAQRRHEWFRAIIKWLKGMVEFPELNLPGLNPPSDPKTIDPAWIERAAIEARRFWGLGDGPILNVVTFLEKRGVLVSLSDFESEDLDAFSECNPKADEAFISLSADRRIAARSNFTAAHELGHLLVHGRVMENVARRTVEHKLMEQQADSFASFFLLPASTFAGLVRHPSLDLFRTLKAQWHVSIGAMIMRTNSLGLLTEDQYRRLWIAYSKRGWKHGEPYDDTLGKIRPRAVRDAFELILNERIVSREQILFALPYASSDIESLCGLQHGFLSDFGGLSSGVTQLPSSNSTPVYRAGNAAVLPFERTRR